MKDLKETLIESHPGSNEQAAADYGMMIPEIDEVLVGGDQESKVTDIKIDADGLVAVHIANGQKVEAKQLAGWIAGGQIEVKSD